jgi:hypothetical protein
MREGGGTVRTRDVRRAPCRARGARAARMTRARVRDARAESNCFTRQTAKNTYSLSITEYNSKMQMNEIMNDE